jgi:N-acetylmuramoyl-L-alanine amidase
MLAAGALRERLYRLEHREADALEAVELYQQAARTHPEAACRGDSAAALLLGELHGDPASAVSALLQASSRTSDAACRTRVDAALATLAAYAPAKTRDLTPTAMPAAAGDASPAAAGGDGVVQPSALPQGPATISKIERYGAADAARVVVFISQPVGYKVGFLEEGSANPRLFVDVEGARYHGKKSLDVGGLVERIRVGAGEQQTRIVLDLKARATRRVFYLPEPFRLVIDVAEEGLRPESAQKQGPRHLTRIVLDPGHGGRDPGASGPGGLREKDVTLDIAHRAAPLIARELSISTLLTRDGDDYVALDERTARANAFGADLFISIHCNASEDGGGRGVMTFVLDDSRDRVAARIAARENAASEEAAVELANALGRGSASSADSSHFAELLQRAAIASLAPSYGDIPNSGIKRAGFYVLAGARMPAVLFETSFISSTVGETRFNTGDFRQKIADGIVNAIRAYRDGL